MSNTAGAFVRYEIVRDNVMIATFSNEDDARFAYSHFADGGRPWRKIELREVRTLDYRIKAYSNEQITVIESRWRD